MTHYDPDIYDNPTEFQFNRFLSDDVTAKVFFKKGTKLHGHLKPFGDGPRYCMNFIRLATTFSFE